MRATNGVLTRGRVGGHVTIGLWIRIAGCLSLLCLWAMTGQIAKAAAAVASPGWSLNSVAEPTTFSAAETQDVVQVFAVHATGGTYELQAEEAVATENTALIQWNESAQGVQEKLEAIPRIGAGNITVSGGPGDEKGEHPYVVTWVGSFGGSSLGKLNVKENELTGGEKTVVQEGGRDVQGKAFDRYTVTATNTGSRAAEGTIAITDKLPPGIVGVSAQVEERPARRSGECSLTAPPKCIYEADAEHRVVPGGKIVATIYVAVSSPSLSGDVVNEARVSGAGGNEATITEVTPVNLSVPRFGIDQFSFEAADLSGTLDDQAGDHPYGLTTSISFNTLFTPVPGANAKNYNVPQEVKDVNVELPLGFVGDPLATERCREVDMTQQTGVAESGRTACPPGSVVGEVWLTTAGEGGWLGGPFPLYNIVPERGYPAEFGFNYGGFGQPIFLYASVVPSASGYRLRVTTPGALRFVGREIERISLTIFGDPGTHNGGTGGTAFATNPTACSAGPLVTRVEATSWEGAADERETMAYPQLTGCDMLQGVAGFSPRIELQPEQTQADTPSGYEVDLKLPQAPGVLGQLATPDLKNASIALPAGVSLSPAVASGPRSLEACTPAQIDLLGTELGEGHPGGNASPYDDGQTHASPGHCPDSSRVGEVEVKTPLLEEPLKGYVYVAQPSCGGEGQPECTSSSAEDGELYGIYLELAGSGVIVKLHGEVSANSLTGQLTTTFTENPQLPFEEIKLKLYGGQRASLANPQSCGVATATSDLEPWSAPRSGPNATPSWPLEVTGCINPMPLAPGFSAGTVQTLAGGFTPFTMTLTRKDGEQDLADLALTLPPGFAGTVSSVPLCTEPQAQLGKCAQASRIGSVHVAAGAGSEPLWLEGPVYLTGPYKGAPFGLSVVVPAKAGPFNLGNVVTRATISVDPHTAQVIVRSDPFPQVRDGVPLRLKEVNVTVDRPSFSFNPTNCSQHAVTGSVAGDLPDGSAGSTVPVSTPFAVTGCKNLPFDPSFQVSTQGATSRTKGASLTVKVGSPTGQANIAKVHVSLPKLLPSRLETLKLACVDGVFEANPAACPTASAVGRAIAMTPILSHPLIGPAYLVSHGGAAFPDLEIVLQGEGITLVLDGKTDIKNGVTTSSFDAVPDLPVSSFELNLPEGVHSVLGAPGGDLCGKSLLMPTSIVGQNGALIDRQTKVAVTGCKPAIRIVSHSVTGNTATVVASVPSAGKLVASGTGLKRTVRQLGKAGRVTLKLTLAKADRLLLGRHRGRKLRVAIKLHLTPTHGPTLSGGVTVLIG